MNVLDLLKQDHDKVRQLFKEFKSSTEEADHRQIFETIKNELLVHTHVEETIFYPAVEDCDNDELTEMVDEALAEHSEAESLLQEIDELNKEGGELRAKVMELIEKVEHHASEEETEMFPKVREVMNEQELNRLGEEVASEKSTYSPLAA